MDYEAPRRAGDRQGSVVRIRGVFLPIVRVAECAGLVDVAGVATIELACTIDLNAVGEAELHDAVPIALVPALALARALAQTRPQDPLYAGGIAAEGLGDVRWIVGCAHEARVRGAHVPEARAPIREFRTAARHAKVQEK